MIIRKAGIRALLCSWLFVLCLIAGPLAADAAEGKIGIIGDSIASGTHSSEMCRNQDIVDCIQDLLGQHNRDWSYAGGEQSWSIANMLGFPRDRVVDASDDGEEWKDAFNQAVRIMADPEVRTVFIGLGANDVCQGRGHDYSGDLDVIASLIDETLNYLTSTLPPGGSIYWSGVPDVVQMYQLMRNRDHNFLFETCQATWDLDDGKVKDGVAEDACDHYFSNSFCDTAGGQGQATDLLVELFLDTWLDLEGIEEGPCGKVLHSGSTDQDRLEAQNFTAALNRLMAQKAVEWSGRNGINLHYNDRIYQASTTVQPHHLSRVDCYHPSRSGQMKFAYEIWGGFNHGNELDKVVLLDEFDSVDYCTQEFSDWGNCWMESNDDGAAASGDVRIDTNTLSMRSGAKQISRAMNLRHVDRAWLSFNRRRDNLDHRGDFINFQISPDAGLTWHQLHAFQGEADDFGLHRGDYYDISPYATADTRIRYFTASGMGQNDRLFLDNIKVNAWSSGPTVPAAPVYGELLLDEQWQPVPIPVSDAPPVVFMGVAADSAGGAGLATVRNVGTERFEVQLQELNSTGTDASEERVPYLVLQPGTYVMPDGSRWEVGRFDIGADGVWQSKSFNTPFTERPYLLLSLQTSNNPDVPVLQARSVDTAGFEAALFQQVSGSLAGLNETAAYLAISTTASSGTLRIADTYRSYRVSRETLDGDWSAVPATFLKRRDGVSEDAQMDAESYDVLELGRQVFAQQVSSTGGDLAVAQRIAEGETAVNAAILPTSRSVPPGSTASVFATIINTNGATATDCGIAPLTSLPADFSYQATTSKNNPLGPPDTPVDIPAGGNQTYVLSFTPTAPFSPVDVELLFDCSNTAPAPVIEGVNVLQLAAISDPAPDIVALTATPTGDGILKLESTGVFAMAAINLGSSGDLTVSADTGGAHLPVSIALCETDPATGACSNPAAPAPGPVSTSMAAGTASTFTVFVTSTGTIPFDPVNNRIYVYFKDDNGVTRGTTSVAVQTN